MALRLVAELGGDGSGFERMMNKAGVTANRFSSGVLGGLKSQIAAVFTVGAISALTKSTIDWAGKLRDTADQLGVNVEWLQKMQNGAKLAGSDIEDVAKVMLEMNRARQEALQNPEGKDAQSFQRMGISSSDQKNLSTQAMFEKIIGAFKNGASTQLVNDVQEVGGRSARNLIAAFSSQFASDTPILAEQLIDQLDDIGDEFTNLATMMKVIFAPAIVRVAELFLDLVNGLKVAFAGFGALVKNLKTPMDYINALVRSEDGKAKLGTWEDAKSAMLDEGMRQYAEEKTIKSGRMSAKEARKARENSSPQFDPLAITPKAGKQTSADSLVKVGNFLGQAPGAVNAIAERQLTVAREQLSQAKIMADYLKRIMEKLPGAGGGGMSFPPN